MDPTGLLDAVLAVAVFPGGLLVAVAAGLHRFIRGRGDGDDAADPLTSVLVPALAAVVACAMLPLVGSPALRLPPPAGAPGNVVAVAALLAIAVDLGAGSRRAAALAAAAAVPVVALAAAGSSLSTTVISTAGGATATSARACAALLLVLAAAATSGNGRAGPVVGGSLGLAAAALVVPAALGDASVVASTAACLGVVAAGAGLARWQRTRRTPVPPRAGAIAAIVVMVAGAMLALVSNRV